MAKELTHKFPRAISIEDHFAGIFETLLSYGDPKKFVSDDLDRTMQCLKVLLLSKDTDHHDIAIRFFAAGGAAHPFMTIDRSKKLMNFLGGLGDNRRGDVFCGVKDIWGVLPFGHDEQLAKWIMKLRPDVIHKIFSDDKTYQAFVIWGFHEFADAMLSRSTRQLERSGYEI